jgi:hypothetical protein
MTTPLTIIIVEKNGDLRTLNIKHYKEEELYKKCGFKKADDFLKHCEWTVKLHEQKYFVSMFGKIEGKANMENKYEFPPPIDTKLFFGCCALVCSVKNPKTLCNMSLELWSKIYEKLFGGFEDLTNNDNDDEDEEDELENIPKNMKTSVGGYLKDGFVVDDDDSATDDADDADDEYEEMIGSELSEEQYDY